ncbi:hypothetical protein JCM3775_003897 [Rhodotorula graminis]
MLSRLRTAPRSATRFLSTSAAAPSPLALAREPQQRPTSDSALSRARTRIANRDHVQVAPPLVDSFGRKHDYLRLSLTEKCNLRCTYCMPEQGVPLLPKDDLLTADEIERVARVFVDHGVRKIRLTGGEPTIRRDIVDIVERLGRLSLSSLGMTSNGIALKRKLPALVSAGLSSLNLSLDTLDPFKYELVTRRRGFDAVMDSLDIAQGLKPKGLKTKVNVVVIRGLNDHEVPDFVELTRERDITVRFIEYMPFEDNRWSTAKLVPSSELLSLISARHPASGLDKLQDAASDTTRAYRVPGYAGSFGFISSMTDHFCGGCSRLRIGADGRVKVCLFGPPVLSLRPLLRSSPASPTSDAALMHAVGGAVYGKKFAHDGLGGPEGIKREGKMGPMVGIASLPISPLRPTRRPRTRTPLHLLGPSTSSPLSFPTTRLFSSTSSPRTSSSSSSDDNDSSPRLTHIDPSTGKAAMVSVAGKASTLRSATAVGRVYVPPAAFALIDFGDEHEHELEQVERDGSRRRSRRGGMNKKGDVVSVAQLAGLMGAKHTSLLIPLCHPVPLSHVAVELRPLRATSEVEVRCTATCEGATGVEMEALTGVSVAALTVWDMCKAAGGKEMEIRGLRVVSKSGGKSGDWVRPDFDEQRDDVE